MKDNWQKEFADRFARHEDELKWLYYELYHCDEQAYDYFTDMLYRCWEERSESLRMMEIGRASCRERVIAVCRSRWSPYH